MKTMDPNEVFDRLVRRDVPRMCEGYFSSIPDENVVRSVWTHLFERKPEEQSEMDFLAALTPEGKWLHLIMIVDGEVGNGGFNQYFFNTEGAYADATVIALQKFCGPKHAEPLEAALRFIAEKSGEEGREKPRSIQEMLDALGDAYDDLDFGDFDAEWKRLEKARKMQMARFMRANSAAFIDTKEQTAVSDALNEPKTYTDSSAAVKTVEALEGNDPTARIRKIMAISQKYREAGALIEAETALRQTLVLVRWMSQGFKNPIFFEILNEYQTLLDSMDRKIQSEAVQGHIQQHGQLASKSKR